jgi:hypothetical protein
MVNPKFYFQHDNYSRDDEKLIELRMKHQMTGLGVYWCLVEMLHEGNGYIETKPKLLAFQLQVDEQVINDVVEICFTVEDGKITCNRVKQNLNEREEKKKFNQEKGKRGAEIRWNKNKKDPNEGIVEVINNHSTTIVEPYSNHSTTIVNDTKEKEKEKEKEIVKEKDIVKDKDIVKVKVELTEKEKTNKRLLEIFKYEIKSGEIKKEQILDINLDNLRTRLNLYFNETHPTWEKELMGMDATLFCVRLENKFDFDNTRIAMIKAYKLLNK